MKIRVLILCFFAFTQNTFAQNAAFARRVKELAEVLRLPGYSLAVVKDGKVVYRQMDGYANLEKKTPVRSDDLFMIASVTKTMTANLVMQYEQEHLVSLEDYILNYRYVDIGFGWPYNIDPNAKIKHFLSQTSEDGPGSSFVYNGSRFNYLYGIFEKAGNHSPETDAYKLELQKRVLNPLGMKHTIFGFPKNRTDSLFRHIATPYLYDQQTKNFTADTGYYARWTRAFPSGGLLSTIDDLVKYTNSYDNHTLITQASYDKITIPTKLNDGTLSPYGMGWFSEAFAGKKIHWHYGQAENYAALFIRVPESGYTFIFLSNANGPSYALRLGSGGIWESPLAAAFLRYYVFEKDKAAQQLLQPEEFIGKALFLRYAGRKAEAQQLINGLAKTNPERFKQYDPGLTYLLTDLQENRVLIDQMADGYSAQKHIQPYVITDLARYYEAQEDPKRALQYYRQLADAKGFEFWQLSADAARKAGQFLIKTGKTEEGRQYYWKAINDMKMQWADDNAIREVIKEMNLATAKATGTR
ncbi:CubicO group peptidase, beta-lactamase class C family [Mucilaginibacter pineti]|uniref:CubicO group peptidase, beta-lactamase class C family n=1 Tax=Mucilaginibacter pineti TaxID=1391627 RepID=A0A1G7EKG0_9SPHI|nr:serine hydrolase domain-containing protein [Mucilaginibacter pineti]SDE64132.1 CubicO group peptidase, beta-lactamase class C family [Mucilaginibacter pineti]